MAEKIYLGGGGKEVTFQDGGSLINIYIDVDDAEKNGFVKKSKKGVKYLSFTLAKRREPTEFGDTHYVYGTNFDKDGGSKSRSKPAKASGSRKRSFDDDGDNDLPF